MEFKEKLQGLRRQKGLTQEALAEKLCVSRTAVSKWESGRGYPGVDSLMAMAKFFGTTVDELLSGEELLCAAKDQSLEKGRQLKTLMFGLMDCAMAANLFLPLFRVGTEAVPLMMAHVSPYLKAGFLIAVVGTAVLGVLTLALQRIENKRWQKCSCTISLAAGAMAALLFIVTSQPYAALMAFLLLGVKAAVLINAR